MNDQILFLSRLEFSILLMLGGITDIISFTLSDSQSVDDKQIIEAVYELSCMGCIRVDETSIGLTDLMKVMTETIKEAERCLIIEPGDPSLAQKVCYAGNEVIVVENVQEEGKAFRLFSVSREAFFQWMEDSMDIPRALAEKKTEAEKILELSEMAPNEKEKIHIAFKVKPLTLSEWMKQAEEILNNEAYAGMRLIRQGKQRTDMLICQGNLNMWIIWYDKTGFHMEADSAELRKEMESLFWRDNT